MNGIRTLLAAVACLVCLAAQAQWQWIDKDGRKVFSDRAPPADVPAKNILKQPGGKSLAIAAMANAAPAAAASAPGTPGADAPQLSAVDKDLAAKKKQAEAAEAAKAKAEEDKLAKAKADNCERARTNKALMDSGVRVSQTDSNGERVVLDDAGRAAESKRAQQVMVANCK